MALDIPRSTTLPRLPEASIPRPGPLVVGGLEIFPPVLQAPMSSLTTLPVRTLAEEHGCGLTITEWLPADALAAGVKSAEKKLRASVAGRAFGVQLFGRDPKTIARAAAMGAEIGAAIVDLNMGCPGKRVRSGGTGAALMLEPELAAELVAAAIEGVSGRAEVTVKMRAGWDRRSLNAPEFASRLVAAGARMITVHGRTRQERYRGKVELAIIRRVKEAVDVPVVANGDIIDLASMVKAFEETSADAVMVGRAALGNPWIFAELAAFWRGSLPVPPDDATRVSMYLRHLGLHREAIDDERRAVFELRKFARWYLFGVADEARLRREINRLEDVSAVRELLEAFLR